jgi:xanthine dehydrogenase accessory factor
MDDIFSKAIAILRSGEDLVLVRITNNKGSTPRSAGAMMVISRNGRIIGTIGGGLVDASAIKKAKEVFQNSLSIISIVDMSAEEAAGDDMICGGRLEFLCDYIPSNRQTIDMFESSNAAQRTYRKHILCTEFQENGKYMKAVRRFLIQDGYAVQELSASPDIQNRLWEMGKAIAGSAFVKIDDRNYCIDVLESNETVFIFGAGHVGKEVAMLAMNVGFRVIVFDDRDEFANENRFPAPAEVIVFGSFDDCFKDFDINEGSYIIIVTRGHVHDKTVLGQALATEAGYIGMIGSRRKRDILYSALLSEGFRNEDLKRVESPIGLPIDTDTPEEIAVSIVGQLIHLRSQKRKWNKNKSQLSSYRQAVPLEWSSSNLY